MLALPLKRGDPVDWKGALHKYVCASYSKQQADAHAAPLAEVAELRDRVSSLPHLSETTVDDYRVHVLSYLSTLDSLERRFDVGALHIHYMWKDAFQPLRQQGEAALSFERAATLFNLSATLSYGALVQNRETVEGLRVACQGYQHAAGVLEALEALVAAARWQGGASPDLSPRTLAALRKLMLAQAQRCFYEQAASKAGSAKVLAKLAAQVALFLEDVHAALAAPPLKSHVDASWAAVVSWNLPYFRGLSQQHLAEGHGAAFEWGAQVARLDEAVRLLTLAAKASNQASPAIRKVYIEALQTASRLRGEARADNDRMYFEEVVALTSLPPPEAYSIVKPVLPPELAPGGGCARSEAAQASDQRFKRLLPASVRRALTDYGVGARAAIEGIYLTLEGAVERGRARLLELDLPHALQAVEEQVESLSHTHTHHFPRFVTAHSLAPCHWIYLLREAKGSHTRIPSIRHTALSRRIVTAHCHAALARRILPVLSALFHTANLTRRRR